MWKNFLRNYFTFNKRERNGLIVLLIIMLLITFYPTFYQQLHKDPPVDFSAFQMAIDSFISNESTDPYADKDSTVAALAILDKSSYSSYGSEKESKALLFPFDPNALDETGWRSLGISEKNIKTILKYRSKGGMFFKKEDLKKIYGFSESEFNRLEPYIQFPDEAFVVTPDNQPLENKVSAKKTALLDLNTADSIQLVSLRGIGPVLSSRIIKYRKKLGGYVTLEQLKEVYGLTPESFDIINDQLSVAQSNVYQININTVSIDELKQHPYFRYSIATMVINYREQHGSFKQPEDLKNIELITDSIFGKIIPYLQF